MTSKIRKLWTIPTNTKTQHTDNDKFCPVFLLLILLGIFLATNIKAYAYVGL